MIGGMLDAVKGCLKEEMRMDVISSNLANATVVGFKKDKISFQEILGDVQSRKAGAKGGGLEPADTALVRIKADHSPGDLRTTGNSLDLAINGKGFFKVETRDGVQYTRRGNFTLDAGGNLVTQEGFKVVGAGGAITISGTGAQVDGSGAVKVDGNQVGQIQIVDFADYDGLMKAGNGLFSNPTRTPEVPVPAESRIAQGSLELSNVNMVDEMVAMIHCMRAFESYQKAIQVLDGLDNRAVNEVSRLR
ncbi:MAG: flagellar basal-body rod protein FlgF [Thermodesulfobacteriota bacterium]